MKQRILSVALIAVMILSLTLTGCGNGSSSDGGENQGGDGKIVGVAMPTLRKVDQGWQEYESKA